MATWVWVLLGLSAVAFVLWLLEDRMKLDVTERFGTALTILFILAFLGGLLFAFLNADWQ